MAAPVVIVSDTSPVRALHHLARVDLFRELYGTVLVPPAVRDELQRVTRTSPAIDLAPYPWLVVAAPHAPAAALGVPPDLDPGETEAIALALELHADLLLIDERKGTPSARQLGVNTLGVLGVLLEAKRAGLIPLVLPALDQLAVGLNFFVSPALRQHIATLAQEQHPPRRRPNHVPHRRQKPVPLEPHQTTPRRSRRHPPLRAPCRVTCAA